MINIQLLSTTDPPNKVEKSFSLFETVWINLKNDTDLFNPSLLIDRGTTYMYNILAYANYARFIFSPTNIRYYFVIGVESVTNNAYRVDLKEDVLMTFAAQIKALKCTVARQENVRNGYLVDSEYNALCYKAYVTKAFPNAITADSLYLVTTG